MSVNIGPLERSDNADLNRLVEDLVATLPLFADRLKKFRPIHPTLAILEPLGRAYVNGGSRAESYSTARMLGFEQIVNSWNFPVLSGSVRLSYFLLAIVLGRPDLGGHVFKAGLPDWDAALQWLVLHGIYEMQLWPFLSTSFVAELRAASERRPGGRLSPLQILVIRECPTILDRFGGIADEQFQNWFADWIVDEGTRDYHLSWLLQRTEFRRVDRGRALGLDRRFGKIPTGPYRRANYRSFGRNYPCSYMVLDEEAQNGPTGFGRAGSPLSDGIDLTAPEVSIQLPMGRPSGNSVIILELIVPEALRRDLRVRIDVEGHQDEQPASEYSGQLVEIPITFFALAPILKISFLGPPVNDQGRVYGVLRSLRVWTSAPEGARAGSSSPSIPAGP